MSAHHSRAFLELSRSMGERHRLYKTELILRSCWPTIHQGKNPLSTTNLVKQDRTQAGPGRRVKQEQEEISPNYVQRLNLISVVLAPILSSEGRLTSDNDNLHHLGLLLKYGEQLSIQFYGQTKFISVHAYKLGLIPINR